jgi:hypothetical protein
MLQQREKKTRELLRKLRYLIEFREVMDAISLIFLGFSIALWGYFLKLRSTLKDENTQILALVLWRIHGQHNFP